MDKMDKLQLPYRSYGRGGAPYQITLGNKKIGNVLKWKNTLINDAAQLWMRPFWQKEGRALLLSLLHTYETRAYHNLTSLESDPSLVLVGKLPNVGTGWKFPWDNRHAMSRNFRGGEERFRLVIEQYYKDLYALIEGWPEFGGQFTVPLPFKGIKGKRSDADILEWSNSSQRLTSQTREVGSVPDSTFHNRGLSPAIWQTELWNTYMSKYHISPNDGPGFARIVTTVPATIPCDDPDAYAFISADAGYHNGYLEYAHDKLQFSDPTVKFGADQVVLSGIAMHTSEDNYYHHFMLSGAPWTMTQYLVTYGSVLANWAEMNDIKPGEFEVLQVGDDLQMRIKRKYIAGLMHNLGPWLKTKGMSIRDEWHISFILGHYFCWKDGRISMMMVPRGLKSVTSAAVLTKYNVPKIEHLGQWYTMLPTEEARASVDDFWLQHPEYVYQLDMDPEDLRDWLARDYIELRRLAQEQLNIGDWIEYAL